MKKNYVIVSFIFLALLGVGLFALSKTHTPEGKQVLSDTSLSSQVSNASVPERSPSLSVIPDAYKISPGEFVGQTFNNCGPASLSMTLSILGKHVSQAELASVMRPFNNPLGGIDDKSIFADEYVAEAKKQGFAAVSRPNGDMDHLKQFIANDIPVVVRTWLNDHEDIGHFRVVTGYDSASRTIIYQDSYYGPNQTQTEDAFSALWKPFNYGYIVIYPQEKEDLVRGILAEDMDEKTAWQNAQKREEQNLAINPNDAFSRFNLAVSQYHLGNYQETIKNYELAVSGLPGRMLWYQLEPIYAYQKVGNDEKAIALSDAILTNGNLAYSELYQVKGEIYLSQGNREEAKDMFEKAVYYNTSFQKAKDALSKLGMS